MGAAPIGHLEVVAVSREPWAWVARRQARPRRRGLSWGFWAANSVFWTVEAVIAAVDRAWIRLGFRTLGALAFSYLVFDTRRRRGRLETPEPE